MRQVGHLLKLYQDARSAKDQNKVSMFTKVNEVYFNSLPDPSKEKCELLIEFTAVVEDAFEQSQLS